ncbi:fructose-6-phosphate aldolase [Calditerrivibrio nitroreducens]|uniref:Probable transaldolase n=1 Tax=Calditerrivibrio nitroreducens (strain DSM 19672 / NBRC 101217 / Yu37-1) TaxID=768670 RepID=E4TI12_CALNY|nr:fructose-6-phosphate aldolase [Calditerrivibrio nitroreducens]ADR18942.1 transaldolase [Calditerrivibrio nitroreducens DSM 19672]
MKIFLDTANIDEIKKGVDLGIIDGVTTNPTLVAKEKKDFKKLVKEICEIVKAPVSAEVISLDAEGMYREGLELSSISEHVVVKIPFTPEGLVATRKLTEKDVSINMTLIFSLNQALLACKAGARYISPFVGRLDDIGHNGFELAKNCQEMILSYGFDCEVIAASIRHPQHVIEAIKNNIDIATLPFSILIQMMKHPLTDIGIEKFLEDWKKANS